MDGDILNYASGTGVAGATSNATAAYNSVLYKLGTSSYNFSGGAYASGNWITVPALTLTGSTLSVALWIYPTTIAANTNIFNYGNLFKLYMTGTTTGLSINGVVSATTASTMLNVWTHLVITVSGTTVAVYGNGALLTTTGVLSAALTGSSAGFLGHSATGTDPNYAGYMDDVRIYASVAMTASQAASVCAMTA